MTPLMIALLVGAGIVVLIIIGYFNTMIEANKVQKARARIEMTDRLRRCGEISETFPGQLMNPALKVLLTRLELDFNQRLLALDKGDAKLKARVDELNALIAQGASIPVANPPAPIQTEAKAKDVRFLLESLHGQIGRAVTDGVLTGAEGKHWLREIRHILVLLHIEFFNNLGQHALQQQQPGQARLAFERGVQYLRKQPEPALYDKQLKHLEAQLVRSNAQVLEKSQPADSATNELTEGLKETTDGDWKKKSVYD